MDDLFEKLDITETAMTTTIADVSAMNGVCVTSFEKIKIMDLKV